MRRLTVIVGLALLAARLVAAPEVPILDPAKVTESALPNGLKLVVKEDRQWPVVALGLYVRAGTRQEGASEAGVAHLVEHLLFESTGDDQQKLAPFIESLGGQISATTLRDFVHVDIVIASRYVERVLPVLLKAVFEAPFAEQALLRELAVVKREIADRRERADFYMDEMLWQLAFDKHPYGRPIGGAAADVDKLTFAAANQFYRRFYVPNNATLVAAGDVEPGWLQGRVKLLTAELKARETGWQEPALDAPITQTRVKAEPVQRPDSLLQFGWRAPSISDKPSVCATDLVYTLLGQSGSGRLITRLVNDQKLLLAADVEFLTQKHPGLLTITAVVPPGREEEAQVAIVKEMQRLAEEPVSDQDLERAKRLLYAEYAFSNESMDDQIGSMGFYASIDTFRFALDYIDQVMKITPAQIQQLVATYFQGNNYALVVLRGHKGSAPDEAAMLL